MAEKEQDHRAVWETKALRVGARDSLVGQVFGLVALLTLVGSVTYMAVQGLTVVPAILAGATTVGTIGAFIRGRKNDPDRRP